MDEDAELEAFYKEQEEMERALPRIRATGVEALKRLLPVAQNDTGQSRVVARFLLGLYNGRRFPFDLTDFRLLDHALFVDCMAVLKMDSQPLKEIHEFIDGGGAIWERLAQTWDVRR